MTFDPVPWFTGGGAQHSPEVARLLAYAAVGGADGIVNPGDLKVSPLAVPGASVRVLAGAALIPNRAAGGSQQTYVARNPTEDVVAISATGSSAGRTDMIVARVEDPFMPGEPWADPTDVTVGPYVFSRVIPNVPSSAIASPDAARTFLAGQGSSAVPLAGITLPTSTATVTSGMIKDLRKLARPRAWQEYDVQPGINDPAGGANFLLLSETNWHNWPENSLTISVPPWATHAQVSILMNGLRAGGPGDFDSRVQFGSQTGAITYFDYNGNPGTQFGFVEALSHITFGEFDVRSFQGTTQTVRLNARRTNVNNTGDIWFGDGEQIIFDIRFRELAV